MAKRAFIGPFLHELKENCGAEVTHHLEEAEGLLADRNGWGVVGIYPTGGSLDDAPDGLLRLQPGYVGNRAGYLLCASAIYCKLLGNFFRIRSTGSMPRARAKVRIRARRGARGRERGRTMGSSQRELRHPTPGTRETLPWGDRLPVFLEGCFAVLVW